MVLDTTISSDTGTSSNDAVVVQVYFPNADSVFALGSFNDWSTMATPLRRGDNGYWNACLPPDADLVELCFFVIGSGEPFGRIRKDWSLIHMDRGHEARKV